MGSSPNPINDWIEVPPVSVKSADDWIEVPPIEAERTPAPIVTPPIPTGPRKRNEGAGKPPAGSPTYLPPGLAPPIIQGALGVEGEPTSIPGQVVKAGAQMAESLTMDPVNAGIMTTTGGLGLLSKLPLLKAALPKAISAGFSAQMLNSAYEQSKVFRDAIDKKDYPKAAHALTSGVLDTVMSAMGLRHAAGIGESAAPLRATEEPLKVEPKSSGPVEDWIEVPPVQGRQENAPAPREEVVQPKPSEVSEVAGAGEGPPKDLKEVGGGMARGITDNMYDMLWGKVQKGDTTEAGGPSTLLQIAKRVRDAGGLQSKDHFKGFAQEYAMIPQAGDRRSALYSLIEKYTPASKPVPEVPNAEPQPSQPSGVQGSPPEVPALPESVGERVPSEPIQPPVRELPEVDRSAAGAPEAKAPIDIPRAEELNPKEREIESRFTEKIQRDPEAAIEEYRKQNTVENGTLTINTDQARELSEDYVNDRTKSRAVHEPASSLMKYLYAQELAKPAPEGLANKVEFTAGGTGAGKTVGSKLLGSLDPTRKPPQILYDTNLNDTKSAVKKIQQALDADKEVVINYVHRPADLAFEGMLHRAMRMAEESGTGRTVPMETHIETHRGSPKTLLELADIYRGDKRVEINVFDNSGGKNDVKLANPGILRGLGYNGIEGKLNGILDKQLAEGRISQEVYDSIRTPEVRRPERGVVPEGTEGAPGEGRTARPGEALQKARQASDRARYGRSTEILIPGSPETYQATYSVRELGDVQASHSGQTFQKNPRYKLQNDRDYSDKRNSGRILSQAGDFKPQYLLTDSPDALNGAPIIDADGNVLGGNSRTMTLDRVYAQRPIAAAHYRDQLKSRAKEFGIDPAVLENMKRPVLVRELHGEYAPQKAVTDFNVAGTAALTPAERAVADSHRVSLQTLNEVAKRIEDQGPDGTLAKALSGDGRALVNRLVEDGAVAAQDKPALLNPDGTFSAEGKSRLSRLLIGRLFEDAKQFDTTAPELRNKLEGIVAPLARVEGKAEWDIGPTVKEAIGLINEAKARDIGIDDLLAQSGMFEQSEHSPAAVAIAKSLSGKATEVAKAFRNYAEEADMATTGTDAGIDTRLLTAEIPTQLEAFNNAFKTKLTEPIKSTPKLQEVVKPVEKIGESEPVQVGQTEIAEQPTIPLEGSANPTDIISPERKSIQPGQTETKPSKLAQGVEEKAIANKLTQGFEGKPEYQTVSVADQAKMAADLIKGDPEKATRIAMGTEAPPEGLLPESVFVAMEDYATANKDVDLLRDLATKSTLNSEATGMGQRIRMLAERDPNSPVAAIQKVTKAREDAATKRFGPKAKDTIKTQIRIEIKRANAKPKSWIDWVESIKCP